MLRFINQGGLPSMIVSDFGTNFKGAINEIKTETLKLDHIKVGNKMTQKKFRGCVQYTLFTTHERVIGKNDLNSQKSYVCYH